MISPVYVLFMTIPCAARGSGEHPQSLSSALCPREQQAVEDWQVVGAQLWQDHHPQPHKKRDKGQNVQGLCEDAGLFPRGPTGTCSCASINPPTEHLYILPILYLGRAQVSSVLQALGHSCSPRSWAHQDKPGPCLGSLPWVGAGGSPPRGQRCSQLCWAELHCPPLSQATVFGQPLKGFSFISLILKPGEHRG